MHAVVYDESLNNNSLSMIFSCNTTIAKLSGVCLEVRTKSDLTRKYVYHKSRFRGVGVLNLKVFSYSCRDFVLHFQKYVNECASILDF